MYTGKCGHAKTCENFKTECHDCPLLKEYPKSLFFDFTRFMHRHKKEWFSEFEKNLTIVAPSKWMEERIRVSFLKKYKIKYVPNGINTKVFNYKKSYSLRSNPELKKKVLFLSVIAKPDDSNKGFKWILDYSKKVHEEVVFVVVGKNFPKSLPKNIHVIDYVANVEELATLYRECDAYLMVSEYENYPTVCLEASATSLPIIGFDSGGVSETTIGNTSLLFPYGSPELLATINSFEPQERKINDKLHLLDQETMRNRYYEIYQD
jgi:glycosyltransferase involved in cell wall biosynthesis